MKYRLQVIIFVLVAFMLGCNEFMVVGILSDIADHLNVSIAATGYLVTIFATTYALGTPFVTILTSRYSRYKTLLALIIVFFIGNTLSALAVNYWVMMLSRIITASVAGSIESLIMIFASQVAPREKRAGLVSWIYAGFSIASVLGVPIGTTISTNYSWRDAFLAISVVTVIVFGLLTLILPKHIEQVQSSIRDQLVILKDRRIYVAVILVLFTAATFYAYYTYIRPILTSALGFNVHQLNWLLFVIGLVSIMSNWLSGTLANHDGLKKMPPFYMVDIVLLVLLPFGLMNQVIGYGMLLILSLIVTVLGSPIQIHFMNIAEQDYPQAMVFASSLNAIFFNFGISLGSATASMLIDPLGVARISWGAAVYAALSLGLMLVLNRVMKRHQAGKVKVDD